MGPVESIDIEVAASPAPRQVLVRRVQVPAGTSLQAAVQACGLLAELGISLPQEGWSTGVWGKPKPLDTPLRAGDRVELYRALTVDPKEARRQRYAQHKLRAAEAAERNAKRRHGR